MPIFTRIYILCNRKHTWTKLCLDAHKISATILHTINQDLNAFKTSICYERTSFGTLEVQLPTCFQCSFSVRFSVFLLRYLQDS